MMHASRVTTHGLHRLQQKLASLKNFHKQLTDQIKDEGVSFDPEDTNRSANLIQQVEVQNQIFELENIITHAEPLKSSSTPKQAAIGCRVEISDGDHVRQFMLVQSIEADPSANKISIDSPLGRAVNGKKVHDTIAVQSPAGNKEYTIVSLA